MNESTRTATQSVARYDTLCIGAGPANLALAEELLRHDRTHSVLILDKGRTLSRRRCPLAEARPCPPCGLCHAVHGVAGAGAYSDGKVSFWPAGSGLRQLAGSESRVLELDARLKTYYAPLFGAGSSVTTCSDAHDLASDASRKGIQLKPYDVAHAGSEAIQEFYAETHDRLVATGARFQLDSQVLDVVPHAGAYEVRWRTRAGLASAQCRHVCLGVGKASGLWLRAILDKLGVVRQHSEIEVGVRLEFPYQVTEAISLCHRDAKFKVQAPDGTEVRTFCFCHRGFVLAAYYEDMTTVSGFSLRYRHSDNTNFALLNRIRLPPSVDPYTHMLPLVQRENRRAGGGALVQRLDDFVAQRETTPERLRRSSVMPTLQEAVPGEICLPALARAKDNLLAALAQLDRVSPGLADGANLVYSPVLEKCWDKIELEGIRTTARNVYVVGDATGHARGLVQAAATGLLAAEAIAEDA